MFEKLLEMGGRFEIGYPRTITIKSFLKTVLYGEE